MSDSLFWWHFWVVIQALAVVLFITFLVSLPYIIRKFRRRSMEVEFGVDEGERP